MSDASWEIEATADRGARLRLDRPGVAAVSIELDAGEARRLIEELADVSGFDVSFGDDVEPDA